MSARQKSLLEFVGHRMAHTWSNQNSLLSLLGPILTLGYGLWGCSKPAETSPPNSHGTSLRKQEVDCKALQDVMTQKARLAQRCSHGDTTQCKKCIGTLPNCGVFVGREDSLETRAYTLAVRSFVENGCPLPMTIPPACDPSPAGSCGAEGICLPSTCYP